MSANYPRDGIILILMLNDVNLLHIEINYLFL